MCCKGWWVGHCISGNRVICFGYHFFTPIAYFICWIWIFNSYCVVIPSQKWAGGGLFNHKNSNIVTVSPNNINVTTEQECPISVLRRGGLWLRGHWGSARRQFWSPLGCDWHVVSWGQGFWETFCSAQDSSHSKEFSGPNVSSWPKWFVDRVLETRI